MDIDSGLPLPDSPQLGRRAFGLQIASFGSVAALRGPMLPGPAVSSATRPLVVDPICMVFDVTTYDSVQAAITALVAAGGGVLYFPTGNHKIVGHLTISNVPVKICGDGVGLSILHCSPNSSLRVTQTAASAAEFTMVVDLSIWAKGDFTAMPYPALLISYNQVGPFRGQLRCMVERVEIRGADPASTGFHGGVSLINCINTSISQFNFIGLVLPTPASVPLSSYGINFVATPGEVPVEMHVENSKFYYVSSAILGTGDHMEGVFINQSTAVIVRRFVDFTNSLPWPMLVVTNSHAAFQETGIYAVNFNQSFISNNLLYAIASNGLFPSPSGIFLSGSHSSQVHHNTIVNAGAPGLNGMIIESNWVSIAHNIVDGSFTGLWLRPASSNCWAIYNAFPNATSTNIVNVGTNNRVIV